VLPGGEVFGLDIQPGMIERLKKHAAQSQVGNLVAIVGDATQQHFRPATFDVVYFVTVLGEIPDRESALRQCYEALKPQGLLSITEIFPDPHFQSRHTVHLLAGNAGFKLLKVSGRWYAFTANFIKPSDQGAKT
jgi:ubiquinone/menaquinone biosynthesis C-methylase UbiE